MHLLYPDESCSFSYSPIDPSFTAELCLGKLCYLMLPWSLFHFLSTLHKLLYIDFHNTVVLGFLHANECFIAAIWCLNAYRSLIIIPIYLPDLQTESKNI